MCFFSHLLCSISRTFSFVSLPSNIKSCVQSLFHFDIERIKIERNNDEKNSVTKTQLKGRSNEKKNWKKMMTKRFAVRIHRQLWRLSDRSCKKKSTKDLLMHFYIFTLFLVLRLLLLLLLLCFFLLLCRCCPNAFVYLVPSFSKCV